MISDFDNHILIYIIPLNPIDLTLAGEIDCYYVFLVSFYNTGYFFYRFGLAFKNGTNGVSKDINKALTSPKNPTKIEDEPTYAQVKIKRNLTMSK